MRPSLNPAADGRRPDGAEHDGIQFSTMECSATHWPAVAGAADGFTRQTTPYQRLVGTRGVVRGLCSRPAAVMTTTAAPNHGIPGLSRRLFSGRGATQEPSDPGGQAHAVQFSPSPAVPEYPKTATSDVPRAFEARKTPAHARTEGGVFIA